MNISENRFNYKDCLMTGMGRDASFDSDSSGFAEVDVVDVTEASTSPHFKVCYLTKHVTLLSGSSLKVCQSKKGVTLNAIDF